MFSETRFLTEFIPSIKDKISRFARNDSEGLEMASKESLNLEILILNF